MIMTLGGLNLMKLWEGLQLTSYLDIAGVPTVGYGHTTDVELGATITEPVASALFAADLVPISSVVAAAAGSLTTDRQFSAMVSLAFNIGRGGFLSSTVLRQHRAGNYGAAAAGFLLWDNAHVDGVLTPVPGLLARRQAERLMYLTPDADTCQTGDTTAHG